MAPAAGVSEALMAALCRVALAWKRCQSACVVNRRLGSGGEEKGESEEGSRRVHKSVPRRVSALLVTLSFLLLALFMFLSPSLADLE